MLLHFVVRCAHVSSCLKWVKVYVSMLSAYINIQYGQDMTGMMMATCGSQTVLEINSGMISLMIPCCSYLPGVQIQ